MAHKTLQRSALHKDLATKFDDFLVAAGRVAMPFYAEASAERQAMKDLVTFYQSNNGDRKAKGWNQLSEAYGSACAKRYLRWLVGRNIPDEEIIEFSGRNTVNLTYIDRELKIVFIVEAKGGGSGKGTRTSRSGEEVKQGTLDYLEDVARAMSRTKRDLRRREFGKTIKDAIKKGQVVYIGVRGSYASSETPDSEIPEPRQFFKLTTTEDG